MTALSVLIMGLLGAAMGSFAALLAERTLRGEPVALARSVCRGCGQKLRASDLVPILSYLRLRGRCGRCDAMIPPLLFQAEIVGAMMGVASSMFVPDPLLALLLAAWMWSLLALAIADLRAFRLPDRLVLITALIGLGVVVAGDGTGWPPLTDRLRDAALGALAGAGSFWMIRVAYRLLRGRDGMGLGDVKLMGALGVVLGLERLPLMVLLAALSALILSLLRAWRRKRSLNRLGRVPFGAALALASALTLMF